ncbi:MAG: hypothetical protein K0S63_754, partial [Gammaproteobacteria bacterium]|nr:hypothetical protein [Gammaproteobacteria bacterium]
MAKLQIEQMIQAAVLQLYQTEQLSDDIPA